MKWKTEKKKTCFGPIRNSTTQTEKNSWKNWGNKLVKTSDEVVIIFCCNSWKFWMILSNMGDICKIYEKVDRLFSTHSFTNLTLVWTCLTWYFNEPFDGILRPQISQGNWPPSPCSIIKCFRFPAQEAKDLSHWSHGHLFNNSVTSVVEFWGVIILAFSSHFSISLFIWIWLFLGQKNDQKPKFLEKLDNDRKLQCQKYSESYWNNFQKTRSGHVKIFW